MNKFLFKKNKINGIIVLILPQVKTKKERNIQWIKKKAEHLLN